MLSLFALTLSMVSAVPSGLFGLNLDSSGHLSLVEVNPKTGAQTVLGSFLKGEGLAQGLATIDEKNGIYYILGFDGLRPNIVGIDITAAKVVSKAEVAVFATEPLIGVGQGIDWEPDTGAVVAAGQDKTKSWTIGLVNPKNGSFTRKAYLNNSEGTYDPVLGSPSVYTTDQGDFIMELGVVKPTPNIEYLAVNLKSGKVAQLPWCGSTETANYDLTSKSIFGVGLIVDPDAPMGARRTLVQVKSDASACTVVGNITGYLMINGGISAIDTENRILYFVAMPCVKAGDPGCQGSGPFDLVGVDLTTAKVVSVASAFCSLNAASCPWSLEFANPGKRAVSLA